MIRVKGTRDGQPFLLLGLVGQAVHLRGLLVQRRRSAAAERRGATMIRVKGTRDGQPFLLLGLSHANLDRLRADGLSGAIKIDAAEMNLGLDIIITRAGIAQQQSAVGWKPPAEVAGASPAPRSSSDEALRVCRGCGCDALNACLTRAGPCAWALLDVDCLTGVCSACAHELAWDPALLASVGRGAGEPIDNTNGVLLP